MMYIQSATGIPFPEGEFNVVGVVKQYDDAGEEGPFYLGYEVLPRYVSDITYGSPILLRQRSRWARPRSPGRPMSHAKPF